MTKRKPMRPKLVRDHIPEIIRETGKEPEFVKLRDPEQIRFYLMQKLVEEATEVDGAVTKDEILEELGDVFEVIRQTAIFCGFDPMDVIRAANDKRYERGGFDNSVLLLDVHDGNEIDSSEEVNEP